jgi:FAD synthetase
MVSTLAGGSSKVTFILKNKKDKPIKTLLFKKTQMTLAMAFGTFSIIHPGHVYYLEKARELSDRLVVVVARDNTVKKIKGKNLVPEEQRRRVVQALKPVDEAVLGSLKDKYESVEKYSPDLVVLGPDQEKDLEKFKHELLSRGLNPKIVRINRAPGKLYKSSRVLEHVCSK